MNFALSFGLLAVPCLGCPFFFLIIMSMIMIIIMIIMANEKSILIRD